MDGMFRLNNVRSKPALGFLAVLGICTVGVASAQAAMNPWINEIHYDNTGTDTNEGVEVAGLAGTALTNYTLYAYNGNGGVLYDTLPLSGVLSNQSNGFGTAWFPLEGLQNGPDGVALIKNPSEVVQFLSYEGTAFNAVDGPASGETSELLPVSESSSEPIGRSLQLVGTGTVYEAFSWVVATASPAAFNDGQVLETLNPGIVVEGNGIPIANGDTSPTLADRTDFGIVVIDGGGGFGLFTIRNPGDGPLEISSVTFTGAVNNRFSLDSAPDAVIPAGGTSSFLVFFDDSGFGAFYDTVVISNNVPGSSPYTFSVRATVVDAFVEAPTTLEAQQVMTNSFTARWQAVGSATGYVVSVATNNVFQDGEIGIGDHVPGYERRAVGNVTQVSVTGLTAVTPYHFRVKAYSTTAEGNFSPGRLVTTLGGPADPPDITLAVTEFMPQNEGGSTHDYIELYNYGTNPVSLAGCSVTVDAGTFAFTNGTLASGRYLILASDTQVFQSIWTVCVPVFGNLPPLSDTGGEIIVRDPSSNSVWNLGYPDPFNGGVFLDVPTIERTDYGTAGSPSVVLEGDDFPNEPGYQWSGAFSDPFERSPDDGSDLGSPGSGGYRLASEAPSSTRYLRFNELEFNSTGTDGDDFIELIGPAGTQLEGVSIVHYNGANTSDGEVFRFTFPSFVLPDDGITDVLGNPLGLVVLSQSGSIYSNVTDFTLPQGLLGSNDGLVLYDTAPRVLDAIAWGGTGDLTLDDPGTVSITVETSAATYLHVTPDDSGNDDRSVQAPNDLQAVSSPALSNAWSLVTATPGALNQQTQTNGMIHLGIVPEAPPVLSALSNRTVRVGDDLEISFVGSDANGDEVILSADGVPPGAVFFDEAGLGVFSWLNVSPAGVYTVNVFAVDNDGAACEDVVITVSQPGGKMLVEDWETPGALFNWTEGVEGDWGAVTVNPIEGSNTLRHLYTLGGGASSIARRPDAYQLNEGMTRWRFQLRNGDWDPSSGNRFWVFLTASTADLDSPGIDGYAVGVQYTSTGTPDPVILWRVTNLTELEPVITSAFDWGSSETVGVEVLRTADGEWELRLDADGGFDNLVSAGTAVNTEHLDTDWFGLYFDFTETRAGELWWDDICIEHWRLDIDREGDGMSDAFEFQYFGNATGGVATVDSDQDGTDNESEEVAGTNPVDSNSVFAVESMLMGASVQALGFSTVPGRVYDLEQNTNLPNAAGWVPVVTNLLGTGGTLQVTNPVSDATVNLRISVKRAP